MIVIASGFLRSVCVEVFTIPYDYAPGGATGIAAMVEYKTGLIAGWTILIVNAPLLVFAFFRISKRFAITSGVAIGLSAIGMLLMDKFNFPVYENGEPVLAACASGVLGGIALAMMLKVGGSTGGTDIVATAIQKKFSATHVSWFIYGIDAIIVFASAFVYEGNGLTPVLMSLAEMFCLSMTCDVISSGFKTALKFEIITKEPDGLSNELIQKLGRGVTCVPVRGMYSNDEKSMLICVIRKRQLSDFNDILKKYPDTFAYVSSTSEVMGLGFSR
ncbi:MAG: YitT family protein [Clostridiales bacterium]|nr:YitT family protein [Clostridiales bacterium]